MRRRIGVFLGDAVGRGLGMTAAELDEFAAAFEHGERAIARRLARS